MTIRRQKFASQASPQLLTELRALAQLEGRQFQAVLEDAMRDYLEKHHNNRARAHVMELLTSSIAANSALYTNLNH